MGRQAERKARRHPSRRTSEEIVDAIVSAAAELVAESGLVGLTTNHVAERAGVSIGSVYRYFPDKESIVAELDLRVRREAASRFVAALTDFQTDFPGAVRRALRTFIDAGPAPGLRAALMRDVPAAWVMSNAKQVWSTVVSAASQMLAQIRPDVDLQEARRRVFYAIYATQGVTNGLMLWPLEDVTLDETLELLAQQLTSLLLAPPGTT